ncbi:glutathione S-transferase family protein [Aliiglaciecola sp. LCG003]|uniref:glutathione S-transferase family protein n=1 Tax=Aliiglaciecola sp. LCG003 TaxID=3053655 RepID=UPI002573734A|nr:glutathione S-transferase family protein [Aliiglaciecola sp. LCG003]WJG08914.1 glutathione S-transferase family protein [Aliiglaciecola sp. LCG003]
MIKLYGSTTSPFVRRLRMWMANMDHEFINLQIFTGKDRETLANRNPTLKIPMIECEGDVIFDSRVIYRYLTEKFDYPKPSWEQENQLTLIDAATDSLVQMLLLDRSEIDTSEDKMYFKLQRERVNSTLSHLNMLVDTGSFSDWNYPAICLFSLIDWIEFRRLHDLNDLAGLLSFHEDNAQRIEVTATDPRKG